MNRQSTEKRVQVIAALVEGNSINGTPLVSKGNIEWRPKGHSVNKRRLTWAKFGEFMELHGKAAKIK